MFAITDSAIDRIWSIINNSQSNRQVLHERELGKTEEEIIAEISKFGQELIKSYDETGKEDHIEGQKKYKQQSQTAVQDATHQHSIRLQNNKINACQPFKLSKLASQSSIKMSKQQKLTKMFIENQKKKVSETHTYQMSKLNNNYNNPKSIKTLNNLKKYHTNTTNTNFRQLITPSSSNHQSKQTINIINQQRNQQQKTHEKQKSLHNLLERVQNSQNEQQQQKVLSYIDFGNSNNNDKNASSSSILQHIINSENHKQDHFETNNREIDDANNNHNKQHSEQMMVREKEYNNNKIKIKNYKLTNNPISKKLINASKQLIRNVTKEHQTINQQSSQFRNLKKLNLTTFNKLYSSTNHLSQQKMSEDAKEILYSKVIQKKLMYERSKISTIKKSQQILKRQLTKQMHEIQSTQKILTHNKLYRNHTNFQSFEKRLEKNETRNKINKAKILRKELSKTSFTPKLNKNLVTNPNDKIQKYDIKNKIQYYYTSAKEEQNLKNLSFFSEEADLSFSNSKFSSSWLMPKKISQDKNPKARIQSSEDLNFLLE